MQNTSQSLEAGGQRARAHTARIIGTPVFRFLLLGVIFSLVYTQSPLFTSNQNQYFLHGLAQAGYGYLHEDWLAKTLDPTPVFSALVSFSYILFHANLIYYLIYGLLMAVYLVSLIGIVSSLFDLTSSTARRASFLALVLALHSAGLRFALSRVLGDNWTYVLEDGVADQRLLGPVFQPSAFGVFLLLSIFLFLKNRPYLAVLSAVLAATFHPTYLLSAAALSGAYMLAALIQTAKNDRVPSEHGLRVRRALAIGALALVAVLPILAYVYLNFGDMSGETTARAREILVNYRIPHHAKISWWWDATAMLKIAIVLTALYLVRRTRLFLVLLVAFVTAAGLTLLQLALDSNALALIFPWRLSTFLVPLSSAILLGFAVAWVFDRFPRLEGERQKLVTITSLVLITGLVSVGSLRLTIDFSRKAGIEARTMMNYVAANHDSGEVYFTPVKLQDFRLATGSPVYVDFKSIPYREDDVLEWYRRMQLADRFYLDKDCSLLTGFQQEGVSHVILESDRFPGGCPGLKAVYTDPFYSVYRFSP